MPEAFLSLPPLNALRAFEAAARHLNFRIAAQELNVTQGAVAQHIRGLEADLGAKLFERLPRGLALTDEGRAYVPNIRRAFELISEATLLLRPEPARLTISVTQVSPPNGRSRNCRSSSRTIHLSTCASWPAKACRVFKPTASTLRSGKGVRPSAPA